MTRPAPTPPGPRPENQRKRTELRGPRTTLIGLLALAAVAALAGLVVLGPPLLIAVAVTQAAAAALLAIHHPRARMTALGAALLVVAWGAAQVLVLDVVTWFSLVLLATGALEALLVAGCTPRDAAKAPRTAWQRDLRAKP